MANAGWAGPLEYVPAWKAVIGAMPVIIDAKARWALQLALKAAFLNDLPALAAFEAAARLGASRAEPTKMLCAVLPGSTPNRHLLLLLPYARL